ncbi:hypothetical protein DPMN_142591, partial [Dreissena polymorpha]
FKVLVLILKEEIVARTGGQTCYYYYNFPNYYNYYCYYYIYYFLYHYYYYYNYYNNFFKDTPYKCRNLFPMWSFGFAEETAIRRDSIEEEGIRVQYRSPLRIDPFVLLRAQCIAPIHAATPGNRSNRRHVRVQVNPNICRLGLTRVLRKDRISDIKLTSSTGSGIES